MSMTMVPYTCPRRNAKSSIPTAVTLPVTGSGTARTRRSSVDRLTGTASRRLSRDPARPASINPIVCNIVRNS